MSMSISDGPEAEGPADPRDVERVEGVERVERVAHVEGFEGVEGVERVEGVEAVGLDRDLDAVARVEQLALRAGAHGHDLARGLADEVPGVGSDHEVELHGLAESEVDLLLGAQQVAELVGDRGAADRVGQLGAAAVEQAHAHRPIGLDEDLGRATCARLVQQRGQEPHAANHNKLAQVTVKRRGPRGRPATAAA
jgi:hypothetical protein